jgi:hypothetical protein
VNRKLALILAAIVLPGGFLALLGAIVFRALTRSKRGRRVVALAKKRMPVLQSFGAPLSGGEQAA